MKNNFNGLPINIRYCNNCNISNQQPTSINEYFHTKDVILSTVAFDNMGVCAACNFNKKKFQNKF